MAPLRLVLITPRYWPHAGDLESTMAHLAQGCVECDARVTVLTGSWHTDWPKSFVIHNIPVIRVAHAPRGGWSTYRYLMDIRRWLREHQEEVDAVCVQNLRYEAITTISALRGTNIPILLRSHEIGLAGDVWWQSHFRFGSRVGRYCRNADVIVVPNSIVADELAAAGYDPVRLKLIPPGIVPGEARSADRRFRARTALAEVNHDLAAAEYAPVALYIGRLDDVLSLSQLISEWRAVGTRWPSARLWLIGDGPARDSLYQQVNDSELRYQVFMPGTFEEWSDLFHAADVFLSPTISNRTQLLLDAMAAGLPVIAADSPDVRAMIEHGTHGLIVPAHTPGAWSAAISQLFDSPPTAAQIGAAACKMATARYPRRQMAESHLELMELLARREKID